MSGGATRDALPGRQQSPLYDDRRPRDAAATSLRTRGPFRSLDGVWGSGNSPAPKVSLGELLGELRTRVFGLPLTFILHGWGETSAEEFLKLLRPLLQNDDALWLIPAADAMPSTPASDGAVILDTTRDTDQRIYLNLVPDLVFFPAEDAGELESIQGFGRRAGVLILDSRGLPEEGEPPDAAAEMKGELLDAATSAHATVCRWANANFLARCTPEQRMGTHAPAPKSELPGPDVDKIGEQLKEIAESLAPPPHGRGSYARRQFRTLIEEVVTLHPERSGWDKELILQAHEKGWPDWTVPCLPSVHVALSSDDSGRVVSFTWDEILTCVPPELGYTVEEELCEGHILKVRLEPAAAQMAANIAAIFESSLKYWMAIPSASERAFLNVLNEAMLQAEGYLWQEGHAETAERVAERRGALVRAMLSIA